MTELSFNLHDVMLLLTAALAVLLALPMLAKNPTRRADVLLAGFILTQGFAALFYLFFFSERLVYGTVGLLGGFSTIPLIALYLMQGPLLLWFSHAITGRPFRLSRGEQYVLGAILLLAVAEGVAAEMLQGDSPFPRITMNFCWPALIVSVVYGFRAVAVLREHNRVIRQQHSNIDEIDLLWLKYAAYGFTAIWIMRIVPYFKFAVGNDEWADTVGAAANVPTILLISWMVALGLSQRQYRSEDRLAGIANNGDPEKSKPPNPELVSKLEHLMTSVRVYQDPDLDVEGLADSMGISPRSLSGLINGHYGKNFYDFVNGYRISEAQRLLEDPDSETLTIQRIFENAGFSSKSTFNTLFKKVTGKTPSEYRRSARAESVLSSWHRRDRSGPNP